MEPAEIHFRQLEQSVDRENSLEKQMLDSDIHHLEVRTGFFDKLSVLAAGSLAVGITFVGSGYQNDALRYEIQRHLLWLIVALLWVLASLIACVLHNFLISRAVTHLSKQIEFTYKAANQLRAYMQQFDHLPNDWSKVRLVIEKHEGRAKEFQNKKDNTVVTATWLGVSAVLTLILGYVIGFSAVISVYAQTAIQPKSQLSPTVEHATPVSAPVSAAPK
jgi:ABC-type multidrug transport system fused ATPase/permease subunit